MTERIDCIVIGAGVVGLAIARRLATSGREVILLEATESIGNHTSSRNSEVIHAGIYYDTGSLKARFCVSGKQDLYRYCAERGIEHRRVGKVIVATDAAQEAGLRKYHAQALANGVDDLAWLSPGELRDYEPAVRCVAGVFSPSTGIIDSHGLMLAYLGDAENAGASIAFRSPVESGAVREDGIHLSIGGDDPTQLVANTVINSAGLDAQAVARAIRGVPAATVPPTHYAIGHYFTLSGRNPFRHLVYPVARKDWLGVHVTLDLGGCCKFGPDFAWIDRVDYAFDATRRTQFAQAIRDYYPDLDEDALQPGYTGIRPKITGPGEPAADFVIHGPAEHGVPGLVNLFGIESPGLTSSMAIADHVASLIRT
jgi:L-2-hydroxyglutarate oxidase LhgO